jgi:hypothetical protein
MEEVRVDDATLKLLQDYAVTAAERLGLHGSLSASDRRVVALTIVRKSDGHRYRIYRSHPYSTRDDAVQFIDRMLEEPGKGALTASPARRLILAASALAGRSRRR